MSREGSVSGAQGIALGVLGAILLGLSLYHFAASSHAAVARGVVDFPIFLQHAEQFLETGQLYYHADYLAAYGPGSPVYKFPPLYALFLLPLVRDGIHDSVYLYHWGLQILLYLGTVVLCVRSLRTRRVGPLALAAALLALNFEPFFETLWRLQIETPLLLLLAICFWALRRDRQGLAGVSLGICVMLKVYPGFLLFYFLARRRWRAILSCALTMLALQCATLLVFGAHENWVYFSRILPAMMGEAATISTENLGLGRYVQELFGAGPMVAKRTGQLIVLGLLGASLWLVHRARGRGRGLEATGLEFSLFVALMVFSLPNSWVNYQLLLLIPYLVLIAHALETEAGAWKVWTPLAVGAFLLLFYQPCADPAVVDWPCAQTPRFLGLVQLPRAFHDRMVELRVVGTLAPLLTALVLLLRAPKSRKQAPDLAPE